MRPLANVNPASLADAVARLDRGGARAAAVGGGSDLLGMIKDDLVSPDLLVNLRTIAATDGLDAIVAGPAGLRVGGLVTLTRLSTHPEVASRCRVLAEAAGSAATPQIRNVATLAGNLCQRPWCWYFRQKFPCYKHGGNRCYSRTGENQFNAIFGGAPSYIVHPSDTAPALVALDARFRLVGPGGERVVPAGEFFTLPRVDVARENVLEPNEILAGVSIPAAPGLRSTYAKVLDREAWTHAVVSVALALHMDGGRVRRAGRRARRRRPRSVAGRGGRGAAGGRAGDRRARGRGGTAVRRRRPAAVEEPLQGSAGRESGAPDAALAGGQRVTVARRLRAAVAGNCTGGRRVTVARRLRATVVGGCAGWSRVRR